MRKTPASPETQNTFAAPHPLVERLIERLGGLPAARVLEFAAGRGRNTRAFCSAGLNVIAIDDATAASAQPLREIPGLFAAAISTHGLLHGRADDVRANLRAIADLLQAGGLLYATFVSTRDARFGTGERIDAFTFAPLDGDERGVAHAYFDRPNLAALLAQHFDIESLEERDVDAIAGRWAHSQRPLAGAVHWFAIARKR
jgi:hypothetical protein